MKLVAWIHQASASWANCLRVSASMITPRRRVIKTTFPTYNDPPDVRFQNIGNIGGRGIAAAPGEAVDLIDNLGFDAAPDSNTGSSSTSQALGAGWTGGLLDVRGHYALSFLRLPFAQQHAVKACCCGLGRD